MTVPIEFPTCEKPELSARILKRYSKEIAALTTRCFEITMTTAHDVFFDFSAHVQEISVRTHEGGYDAFANNEVNFEIYIEAGSGQDKKITKWFEDTKKYLDALT